MLFNFGWESVPEPLYSCWVVLQFYFRPVGNIQHFKCIIHLQAYYFPWTGCLCLMWRFLILQHQWRCENYVPTFLLCTLEVTIWKRKKLKFTDKSFTRHDEGGVEKSGLKLVFCFQSWKPNLLLACLRTAWGMHWTVLALCLLMTHVSILITKGLQQKPKIRPYLCIYVSDSRRKRSNSSSSFSVGKCLSCSSLMKYLVWEATRHQLFLKYLWSCKQLTYASLLQMNLWELSRACHFGKNVDFF